jgi:hypothetical protein
MSECRRIFKIIDCFRKQCVGFVHSIPKESSLLCSGFLGVSVCTPSFCSDSDSLLRELKFIKPIYSHPRLLFWRKIRKMPAHSVSLREPEQVAPFHFYINIDDYTGVSATSYKDFLKSIKQVKAKSLSFHVERGDFQKWALDVLKDKKLAKEIGKIKRQKLKGQALRNRLYRIVSKRHKELTSKNRHARSKKGLPQKESR